MCWHVVERFGSTAVDQQDLDVGASGARSRNRRAGPRLKAAININVWPGMRYRSSWRSHRPCNPCGTTTAGTAQAEVFGTIVAGVQQTGDAPLRSPYPPRSQTPRIDQRRQEDVFLCAARSLGWPQAGEVDRQTHEPARSSILVSEALAIHRLLTQNSFQLPRRRTETTLVVTFGVPISVHHYEHHPHDGILSASQ